MIDFTKVKLGKQTAVIDARTLQLSAYLTPDLPFPPDAVDYTQDVTSWGMMLNDQLGDCTIAGCGHAIQVWTLNTGSLVTLPDSDILKNYESWCGYNPKKPDTDQGGVELKVLNDWRKHTFWKHYLSAYADPNPANLEHVKSAIQLFGGVYIGVQLPVSVQNKMTWDVSTGPDAVPGSWGGHCVFIPKYRTVNGKLIFTCISWGELIDITEDFWNYTDPNVGSYIDEVHALVCPDFVNRSGKSPAGLSLAQMEQDVKSVSG